MIARLVASVVSLVPAAAQQPGTLAPIDWKIRTQLYTHKFVSAQSVLDTAPAYLFNHAIDSPPSWGQGGEGFARRVGSTYAQYAVRETIELALFAVNKEDPRYIRLGSAPFRQRAMNVLKSAVIARNQEGRDVFAANSVIAVFGARAIATAWLPPERDEAPSIVISGVYGLVTKAAGNAFREFWPDVRRKLRH